MAINVAAIRTELLPGLRAVNGKYAMIPTQYSKIFRKEDSDMAFERTTQMRFVGLANLKGEGGAVVMDNEAGERAVFNQEHVVLGLGYAITEEAIEDNLYKRQFPGSNLGLQTSFQQTKEIMGANVLNTATSYDPRIGGDGVALCSSAHPYDGGTWANRPRIDVDLGESTLLAAQTAIRQNFVDWAGLKIMARAKTLIVPPSLEGVAIRLTKSELRPGTSDNDVNAIRSLSGGLPGGFVVMDFLTSPFAWFLMTDKPGLLYLQRRAFKMDMHTDFLTNNLLVKATERFSFGYDDPRGIYGSFPTS